MEKKTIICPTDLANALIANNVATEVKETPQPPTTPTKPLWVRFIDAVEDSTLTPEMKVACVAQAIKESGRGTSNLAKLHNNFHGMKFRDELKKYATPEKVEVTSEDKGWDIFASFPTIAYEIVGWFAFLSREPYKGWEAFKDDAEGLIKHIGHIWCPVNGYVEDVLRLVGEARMLLSIYKTTPTPDTPPTPKFKIFLAPGHSEKEPGARSNDGTAEEEDMNRLQASFLKTRLEGTGKFKADIYDPLVDDLIKEGMATKGYDMAIILHHNKYDGTKDPGVEVLYDNDKAEAQSKLLAEKLSEAIAKAINAPNRGAKPFAGTVLDVAERQGDFPVVLTESYFLNPYNKQEAQERSIIAARAIAEVVFQWFKV